MKPPKPKITQNFTNPKIKNASHMRQEIHPSGRRDIYYGKVRNADGSMGKTHGHTLLNKARQVEYARTPDGKVLKETGNHVPKGK